MSAITRKNRARALRILQKNPCPKCKLSAYCFSVACSWYVYHCEFCGRIWVKPVDCDDPLWLARLQTGDGGMIELKACKMPARDATGCTNVDCQMKYQKKKQDALDLAPAEKEFRSHTDYRPRPLRPKLWGAKILKRKKK